MPRRLPAILLVCAVATVALARCSLLLDFSEDGLPCADGGCLAGYGCVSGVCKKGTLGQGELGQTCQAGTDCLSGFCARGVCCNTACADPCNSCNLPAAPGTCHFAPAGSPGTPSCAPYLCSGTVSVCPNFCTANSQCAPDAGCSGSTCI